MHPFVRLLVSSVTQKYIMSLTGLALVGFVIVHLLGNLTLLIPGGDLFNEYAHHLESLGPLLWAAELGLIGICAAHVLVAIALTVRNRQARPTGNVAGEPSKGGPSRNTLSSRHMLLLGAGILVFIVIHVNQFKFGPTNPVTLKGVEMRDLHGLVIATFQNPAWVLFYVGAMGFLGFHLRHGIWSAFQSLGAMPGVISNAAYVTLALVGVLIAVGFLLLPLWIYFDILGVYR